MQIGLAMPDIGAAYGALPKAMHHLARGDVAPVELDVAFVATLVKEDGQWLCIHGHYTAVP